MPEDAPVFELKPVDLPTLITGIAKAMSDPEVVRRLSEQTHEMFAVVPHIAAIQDALHCIGYNPDNGGEWVDGFKYYGPIDVHS